MRNLLASFYDNPRGLVLLGLPGVFLCLCVLIHKEWRAL